MQPQNQILVKKIMGFSFEEYFIPIYKELKNDQKVFLNEYDMLLKEMNQSTQEEIKEVL